ncbi:MAG: alpha/beta hydrolase [Magnetococcus sp. YQC-9]
MIAPVEPRRRAGWGQRILTVLLAITILGYAGVAGHLYFNQSSMVFRPKQGLTTTPAAWGMGYEELHFESEGHRLHGWWIPHAPERPVILFMHGNASVISGLKNHVELFRRLGLGVMLFDYRGYGLSEGEPSEAGVYADSEAAWNHLTRKLGIDAQRILFYGHSLGGGAATWLALRHAPRALILEGTFLSVPAVGEDRYPFLPINLLSRIRFDNGSRIGQIHVPLMILHSRDDTVIIPRHGLALFAAANEPKTFQETRGSHNTSVNEGDGAVEAGLRRFVAEVWKGN